MRNVTGRTADLLIQSLIPFNVATRATAAPRVSRPLIARCSGCGCPVRTALNRSFWNDMSRRWMTNDSSRGGSSGTVRNAATTISKSVISKIDPVQYLNEAILQLLEKRRPADALQRYLRLVEHHNRMPSHETLYQLCHGLYSSRNMTGLYAVHDTLLLYYKERPMSRRRRRILLYINTMLINLVARTSTRRSRQPPHTSRKPATQSTADLPMRIIEKLCREITDLKLPMSKAVYNSILNMLTERGQIEHAWILFEHMRHQYSIPPNAYTYAIMIKAAAKSKDIQATERLLDDMFACGVETDEAIVGSLVTALCHRHEYATASRLVDQMYYHSAGDPRLMSEETRARLLVFIDKLRRRKLKKRMRLKKWAKDSKRRKRLERQQATTKIHEEEIKVE